MPEALPEMMLANLVAVQADMRLEHYRSPEAFRRKIFQLCDQACALCSDAPSLLAFPEMLGMPLLFTVGEAAAYNHVQALAEDYADYADVAACSSVFSAWLKLLSKYWRALLRTAWRQRCGGRSAWYALRAPEAYRLYYQTFAEAAQHFQVTLVAGTGWWPRLEHEASRGWHIADVRSTNSALSFSPYGRLLDRSHKQQLMPAEARQAGLYPSPTPPQTFVSPLGRMGLAICLDGFYDSILSRLDALAATIVVQPSANHAPWHAAWPANAQLEEGQAWLRYGLRAGLQNRLHLRYGVNPMLVGQLWDLETQGRSSIVSNCRYYPCAQEGYEGLLAIAPHPDREAFVHAHVRLPSIPSFSPK